MLGENIFSIKEDPEDVVAVIHQSHHTDDEPGYIGENVYLCFVKEDKRTKARGSTHLADAVWIKCERKEKEIDIVRKKMKKKGYRFHKSQAYAPGIMIENLDDI